MRYATRDLNSVLLEAQKEGYNYPYLELRAFIMVCYMRHLYSTMVELNITLNSSVNVLSRSNWYIIWTT